MASLLIRGALSALVTLAAIAADASPVSSTVRVPVRVIQSGATVVVEPGDHLWKLSASRLRADLGRAARDGEIWHYWRTVIETNVGHLRSGDPDLIYPGEIIELPTP